MPPASIIHPQKHSEARAPLRPNWFASFEALNGLDVTKWEPAAKSARTRIGIGK